MEKISIRLGHRNNCDRDIESIQQESYIVSK